MTAQEQETFINRLQRLRPGERARLRRQAGRELAQAGDALGLFYGLLPDGVQHDQHERYFLVATLWAMARHTSDGGGNVGASLRRIRTATNEQGLDRRMEALLDADGEQLGFRLRQLVGLIDSERGRVDWRQLLADLLAWDAAERRVQQAWARAYFAGTREDAVAAVAGEGDDGEPDEEIDPAA